jgi:hypothetical protein
MFVAKEPTTAAAGGASTSAGQLKAFIPLWLTQSMFRFASPELEAKYQSHRSTVVSLWTLGGAVNMLLGWAVVLGKVTGQGKQLRHMFPSVLLPIISHLLPALALLLLLVFRPKVYAKHHRVINLGVVCAFICNTGYLRESIMWMRWVSSGPGSEGTLVQTLAAFSNENFFLISMWQIAAVYATGQPCDVLLITMGLFFDMAQNRRLCASPLWAPNPATLSPKLLAAMQNVSSVALEGAAPFYQVQGRAFMSCPAALAFWQVLGWWLACIASFVVEVRRRRAFLRTHAASTWLGPHLVGAALQWPFGSAYLMWKCVAAFSVLCVAFCVILAVALDFLS